MDHTTYTNKCYDLGKEYKRKLRELAIEFASTNAKAKIDDRISDHSHTILVDKINCVSPVDTYTPYMAYLGFILNKDGSINKRQKRTSVHGINLLTVNGVKVEPEGKKE